MVLLTQLAELGLERGHDRHAVVPLRPAVLLARFIRGQLPFQTLNLTLVLPFHLHPTPLDLHLAPLTFPPVPQLIILLFQLSTPLFLILNLFLCLLPISLKLPLYRLILLQRLFRQLLLRLYDSLILLPLAVARVLSLGDILRVFLLLVGLEQGLEVLDL